MTTTQTEHDAARRYVTRNALNPQDAAELAEALGLNTYTGHARHRGKSRALPRHGNSA